MLPSFTRYFSLMTIILGISALYHDSAAALIIDGNIVAAAQEERFSRVKHDSRFPIYAINYVLSAGRVKLEDVSYVAFYDKPFLKFERLLESYLSSAPKGFDSFRKAIPVWLRDKLFLKDLLVKNLRSIDEKFDSQKILFGEHHLSHAASAYYPSPYDSAVVLTVDGVGEWATTTVSIGSGNKLDVVKEINFPHSLGLLYSAFTYYTGFKVNSGEYKVMGLAPYGQPKYKNLILDKLIDLKPDGSYRMDQSYFNYTAGLTMVNKKFAELFGEPIRKPDSGELSQFHMDIAASIQAVTEEVMLRMVRSLADEYKIANLCMAGGVALNCVANGKIVGEKIFDNVWIQPAAGDAGSALGVALAVWHKELDNPRQANPQDSMQGSYLGPSYSEDEIKKELDGCAAIFKVESSERMLDVTAKALVEGKAVGWFQGRMEFGPRSLGARSILGDARSESMQKTLNLKVKFRESFRPFAPSVLKEDVGDWFEFRQHSPYMLIVDKVKDSKCLDMTDDEKTLFGIDKLNIKRSDIPAVTHVDYSARIQTVDKKTNPIFHKLITKFKDLTGCSVLANTSFNVRGEPIVASPKDAFRCFMGTGLDVLIIGNCVLYKERQNESNIENYKEMYELD